MKFGNMLSNPSLGGKVLLGGGGMDFFKKDGQWDVAKLAVAAIVFVATVGFILVLTGYISIGKEGMTGTTQFGVGPTASHIPGYGTYGYAQALTYNLQREPNELAEHQIVQAQRRADRRYNNAKGAGAEGMANVFGDDDLRLKELMVDPLVEENMANMLYQDVEDSLGNVTNPFESMSNFCDNVIADGGVHELLRRGVGANPYDNPPGLAARGMQQLFKGCVAPQENMANLAPTILTQSDRVRRPVNPIFNIGLPSVNPESFRDMKIPRRSERMSNANVMEQDAVGMRKGNFVVLQTSSPNIGEIGSGQVGYQDPTQVDLAGVPASAIAKAHAHAHSVVAPNGADTVPNVEAFGLMPQYKKKGSEITGFSRQFSGGETTRYVDTRPYSGDQVKFLSLSKDNQGAKVVEGDCDQYGRCKISFVEQPGKFTDLVDVIYELNKSEREELMNLGRRFTRYQLNARERLDELKAKLLLADSNSNVKFSDLDQQEMGTLNEFIQINGADIDRYNELVKKSLVKLSSKQYIMARNTPYNACQVPKGMRRYGAGGDLVNLNSFLPANACDYLDYDREINKKALVGNISKDDMVKMSDAIKHQVN